MLRAKEPTDDASCVCDGFFYGVSRSLMAIHALATLLTFVYIHCILYTLTRFIDCIERSYTVFIYKLFSPNEFYIKLLIKHCANIKINQLYGLLKN